MFSKRGEKKKENFEGDWTKLLSVTNPNRGIGSQLSGDDVEFANSNGATLYWYLLAFITTEACLWLTPFLLGQR